MSNDADGLIMSEARDATTIDNLEDASFGVGCSICRLVENASHVAVAVGGPVVVVHPCTLVVTGSGTHPRGETFRGRKGRGRGTDFGKDLLR